MRIAKTFAVLLFIAAIVVLVPPAPPADVILKVASESGNYCHLKSPAPRGDTLFWDRPLLQDPKTGEIVDFYGPCDHDPLGQEEILTQRAQSRRDQYDKANDE